MDNKTLIFDVYKYIGNMYSELIPELQFIHSLQIYFKPTIITEM